MFKKYILLPILIISLLWAVALTIQRLYLETKDRKVEIAIDGDGLNDLALQAGKTFAQAVNEVKANGATALALSEDTLVSLQKRGQVDIVYGSQLNPRFSSPRCTYILARDKALSQRLQTRLTRLLGLDRVKAYSDVDIYVTRIIARNPELEENAGLGFSPEMLDLARQQGLPLVLRPRSFPLLPEFTDWSGIDAIIFAGKTVPGYPQDLTQTAGALERIPVRLGIIEFTTQAGMDTLLESLTLQKRVVRVHSISEKELRDIEEEKHKATLAGLVERWLRAARERNVRLLYIQFFEKTINGEGLSLYDFNLYYLKQISSRLKKSGFVLDGLPVFPPVQTSKLSVLVLGAGVLAALALMLMLTLPLSEKAGIYAAGAGLAVLFVIALLLPVVVAAKIVALAASIIFPLWAILKMQEKVEKNPGPNYLRAAEIFTLGTMITLAGAFFVTALLYGQYFWQKLGAFGGAKVALTLPLLLLFLWFIYTDRSYPWQKFWEQKISYKHLLILAIVTGGIVLYLWRSGNNGNIFVSAWEEKLRGWLDQVLLVRPRSKEFLFGHPLLLLGIYLGLKRYRNILLWLGGMIGQVSLLNTFCHLHTPLSVSLLRALNGWWLGIIAGWILIWIYQEYIKANGKGEQLCLKF